ncbi:polysaccharide biosynthesis tyrosine autokinase [Brenneria uluponensis]|uniref:polysaccharide biosynthesis tyrosine autokinase n=1 Tax=Brenneria uluponensis TaxID=3057057 RepID=UPI0028E601B6|nr:polysaccharide biosynthesis tyrosine autokinase [Brenneria ulupoensis]
MLDNKSPTQQLNRDFNELSLGQLFGILIDNKWLITLIVTSCIILAFLYLLIATPVYRADAMVQVEQTEGSSIISSLSTVLPSTPPASETEIELIKSRLVIGKTVNDLELTTEVSPDYFPVFGRLYHQMTSKSACPCISLSGLKVSDALMEQPLELTVTGQNSFSLTYDGDVIATGRVNQPVVTGAVSLRVTRLDAPIGTVFQVKKREVLNVINEILSHLSVTEKDKNTGIIALSLLGNDRVMIRKILNSITQNYLQQNIESKSAEAARSLEFVQHKIPEIKSALILAEDRLSRYRQQNDSVDLSLEAKSMLDGSLQLDNELNQLALKEADISRLYTKEHPVYKALLDQKRVIEQEKQKINNQISQLPKTQQEILGLTRDMDVTQDIYVLLLNKQQELSITKASNLGNVRIVDPAITQLKPAEPKKAAILLLSVFIGIIVSIGYLMMRTVMNQGVKNPLQLENNGINVIATIPFSEDHWHRSRIKNSAYPLVDTLGDAVALEAVKGLRTSLHFIALEKGNNILMITSSAPKLGKTFISANLSVVMAQANKKVLLIDCDMRRGKLHEIFGINKNLGLSSVLSGQVSAQSVVFQTSVPNMDIIPRGKVPDNPSELLMSPKLDELFSWASKEYDIVIIDSTPLLAVTDAIIVGRYAGISLLVVGFENTSMREIKTVIQRFERSGVNIDGTVLNSFMKRAFNYYAYGGDYIYSYEKKSENR